jgi:hypothetical protein
VLSVIHPVLFGGAGHGDRGPVHTGVGAAAS